LTFDLAVQGDSLQEVKESLDISIKMYLDSFKGIEDPKKFLEAIYRPVPFKVSAPIYVGIICNAALSAFGKNKSEISYSQNNIPCPA